jgi:hypothetical protein
MRPEEVFALLILWTAIAFVLITGIAASAGRNRNPLAWIFISLVITPAAALVLLAFLPKLPQADGGLLQKIRAAGLPEE